MGMEESAGRRVDVGEVEIDRGRGIVRASERERAVRLWDERVMRNSDGLNGREWDEFGVPRAGRRDARLGLDGQSGKMDSRERECWRGILLHGRRWE